MPFSTFFWRWKESQTESRCHKRNLGTDIFWPDLPRVSHSPIELYYLGWTFPSEMGHFSAMQKPGLHVLSSVRVTHHVGEESFQTPLWPFASMLPPFWAGKLLPCQRCYWDTRDCWDKAEASVRNVVEYLWQEASKGKKKMKKGLRSNWFLLVTQDFKTTVSNRDFLNFSNMDCRGMSWWWRVSGGEISPWQVMRRSTRCWHAGRPTGFLFFGRLVDPPKSFNVCGPS